MNAVQIEHLLRQVSAGFPFPPAADRAAWEVVRAGLGEEAAQEFIARSEAAAREGVPALPASLWLEFSRIGRREGYETLCYRRRTMLRDLALGECLEGWGRFRDPLMEVVWAICEESSWAYPAHLPDLPDVDDPYIDLGAAETGFELALVDGLLSSQLPPEVGRRVRREVDRRLLAPYLARDDFWWLRAHPDRPLNNWTAVCNAGVMAAALFLETDPSRLAAILAKGIESLMEYLDTFDEDGGTSEGLGYWSYGFGYYSLIAWLVERRSGGQIRLLDGARIRGIACFPLRTMLSQGRYASFSDAPRRATFPAALLACLGRRLDIPGLLALAQEPANRVFEDLNADLTWLLPALFWDLPGPGDAGEVPARHDWFGGMQWMIARRDPADPDGLVLAAKGGHNAEMHNHNDLGSFIVQVDQEALVVDPGAGRYTRDYFGEGRYELFVPSSLGHPVPFPNGQLQQAGRQFAARLLEHTSGEDHDLLRLELSGAYPAGTNLASLERRLALHRSGAGWVELEDRFAFRDRPGSLESALITFAGVEQEEGAVILAGGRGRLRVSYAADLVGVRVETYPGVELADGPLDVRRVVFSLKQPVRKGKIRLEIEPVNRPC